MAFKLIWLSRWHTFPLIQEEYVYPGVSVPLASECSQQAEEPGVLGPPGELTSTRWPPPTQAFPGVLSSHTSVAPQQDCAGLGVGIIPRLTSTPNLQA